MASPELQAFLAQQRAGFQASLAVRREELDRWASAGSAEARAGLHAVAHRLAGSAGTFGFGEVSRTARALEDELDREAPWDAARQSKTSELLSALRDAMDAAQAPAG